MSCLTTKLSGTRPRWSKQRHFIPGHRFPPTINEDDAACPLQRKLDVALTRPELLKTAPRSAPQREYRPPPVESNYRSVQKEKIPSTFYRTYRCPGNKKRRTQEAKWEQYRELKAGIRNSYEQATPVSRRRKYLSPQRAGRKAKRFADGRLNPAEFPGKCPPPTEY
jgi:hypothetical protein